MVKPTLFPGPVWEGVAVTVTDRPPELPWALAVAWVVVVAGREVVVVVRTVVAVEAVVTLVELVEVGPTVVGVDSPPGADGSGRAEVGGPAGVSGGPAERGAVVLDVAVVDVVPADSLAPPPPQAARRMARTAPQVRPIWWRRVTRRLWPCRRLRACRHPASPVGHAVGSSAVAPEVTSRTWKRPARMVRLL